MNSLTSAACSSENASGFTLVEFLIAASITISISLVLFGTLNGIERTAASHADSREVGDNMRIGLQTITRCIRQAGNDPYRTGFDAVSIIGPSEVRIRSDLTGSEAPGRPDRGDPDGDLNDSGENILIRYNSVKRRIEIVSGKSAVLIIADKISDFNLEFFDIEGNPVTSGSDTRKIRVNIAGTGSSVESPGRKPYGIQLSRTVGILY